MARELAPGPGANTSESPKRKTLAGLLEGELDYHGFASGYGPHNIHAFAAKFPPQLPHLFIDQLTEPGDLVLDPMMGSGTALVEAVALGRSAVGFDIDPLAVRITRVKTTGQSRRDLERAQTEVAARARSILSRGAAVSGALSARFDAATRRFIDFWFLEPTQRQLMALVIAIEEEERPSLRRLLELTLSSVVVTKSGGVTRARDLAHGRPHRVEAKVPRDAIDQFERRLRSNAASIAPPGEAGLEWDRPPASNRRGAEEACRPSAVAEPLTADARAMPLGDETVDLVVTSPPYANAIDYMRAHKFSLVWLGRSTRKLTRLRSRYIGAERVADGGGPTLPDGPERVIAALSELDGARSRVLRRYFTEMARATSEMFRVLRRDAAAVVIVGTSTVRGLDVQTHTCLAEIAASAGFDVVGIGRRTLDRNRRMLPVSRVMRTDSTIERRMHEEHIIGLWKR